PTTSPDPSWRPEDSDPDYTLDPEEPVKDELEARAAQIIQGFLDDTEMLASLAVDLADHYKQTHGRQDAILEGLEERRRDVENKLANFVKAIGMGIFNEDT
ncbi:hypothetical protein V7G09_11350, partial [Cutibacterium avidum]|nr:hypothetical protein [Cutibacterium avidum]